MIFRQNLTAIAAIIGIFSLTLPAAATEVLLRVDCLNSTLVEGTCEIKFPDSGNTKIWNVRWPDGLQTRIKVATRNGIQRWNSQTNQWADSASTGFCWDRKCIHPPLAQWKSLEPRTSKISVECSHPTLGETICQIESVRETNGIRIY
jgi:hypothetical protein